MKWEKFDKRPEASVSRGLWGGSFSNMEGLTQLSHGKGIGKSFWRTKMLELLAFYAFVCVFQ